jgi:hypothetical protein
MFVRFQERIDLTPDEVYAYFRSPRDWPRLYGAFGEVEDRGGGWFAVPLRRFPFPLLARMTKDEPGRSVAWEFGGFWRGGGEVTFLPVAGGVEVRGEERIGVRRLLGLSRLADRLLEARFQKIWASGWRRLRREAAAKPPAALDALQRSLEMERPAAADWERKARGERRSASSRRELR